VAWAANGGATSRGPLAGPPSVLLPRQLAAVGLRSAPPAWPDGLLTCKGPSKGATEYELSVGKIKRTLETDYPNFFRREPNFDIYDEEVTLGMPLPFAEVKGRERYANAICTIQRFVCAYVQNGAVACRVHGGTEYGCALRVNWTCNGHMTLLGRQHPINITAISLYSLAPQAHRAGLVAEAESPSVGAEAVLAEDAPRAGAGAGLSHRICKHQIEFVDIEPPSLRAFITTGLWPSRASPEPAYAI